MLRFLKDDHELAIVLAHEMAHAYRGHLQSQMAKQILGLALGITAEVFAPGTGRAVMALANAATVKFDRDQERESDLYGLIWAKKAGFNIEVGRGLWRRMAIEAPETIEKGFLSSHPSSAERFLAMDKIAKTLNEGLDPLIVFAPKEQKEGKEKMEPSDTTE
jgi:predicted Zn-dependent protease